METFYDWICKHNIQNSDIGNLARIIITQHDRTSSVKNNTLSWHQCLTQLELPKEMHDALDKAWQQYSQSFAWFHFRNHTNSIFLNNYVLIFDQSLTWSLFCTLQRFEDFYFLTCNVGKLKFHINKIFSPIKMVVIDPL